MFKKLALFGEELYQPNLEDIATFLKDLVYLHDRLALLAPYNIINLKEFENVYTSDYFYRRFSRPLPDSDKLKVSQIHLHSPLSIELILGIAIGFPAAAKAFIEIIKIIRDWKLDKKRKELQIAELELKIQKMKRELGIVDIEKLNLNLSEDKVIKLIMKDALRLTRHEVKIKEIKEINE